MFINLKKNIKRIDVKFQIPSALQIEKKNFTIFYIFKCDIFVKSSNLKFCLFSEIKIFLNFAKKVQNNLFSIFCKNFLYKFLLGIFIEELTWWWYHENALIENCIFPDMKKTENQNFRNIWIVYFSLISQNKIQYFSAENFATREIYNVLLYRARHLKLNGNRENN